MCGCTARELSLKVYTSRTQEEYSGKIMHKSMTIERLILLLSLKKAEAFVVYHMISCFPAISLMF